MIKTWQKLSLILISCFYLTSYAEPLIAIDPASAISIGMKIWHNECDGKISGLTTWNEGEKFASLGVGHFNWYPNAHLHSSKDGFPQLIKYMEHTGIPIPIWLHGEVVPPCPWHTRSEFQAAQKSQKMRELRQFLVETIPIQAQFMTYRLIQALPKLLSSTSSHENQQFIYDQFITLSRTPKGIYALVDYINFKGEGTGWFARHGSGWGLLQVLEGMRYAPDQDDPLQAFAWSANRVLTKRAEQASPNSYELKWLPGWRKRIATYLE
jgi:hypothetical protein